MISRESFMALKAGDVVLFNGTPRTVIEGPGDPGKVHRAVTFAIRNRSWTGRAITVYLFSDARFRLRKLGRTTRNLIMKSEFIRLLKIGFDPEAELKREVEEEIGYCQRLGQEICPRLKRLAKRK